MAQDVKSSSEKMEQSFKDVARSTDSIKDATTSASSAVKQMEKEVNSSAKSMEQSMDEVSKKMNVMMAARAAATGARMVGSAVQSIGPAFGMDEDTANKTGAVLTGAAAGIAMGAQLGTAVGGPGLGTGIGAAVGGLVGAGASLLKAGQELQKAAASEQEKQAIRAQQIRDMRLDEASKENMGKWQGMSLEELQRERYNRDRGIARYEKDFDLFKASLDPLTVSEQDIRDLDFSRSRIEKYKQERDALEATINQRFLDRIGTEDEQSVAFENSKRRFDLDAAQTALSEWNENHKDVLPEDYSEADEAQLHKLQKAFEEAQRSVEVFVPVMNAFRIAVEQNENELERKRKTENAVIDAAVADKDKRDRAAYIADLKSAWKADIDSGDFASYRAAGADIKTQFDSAQKALDDFVSVVKKDMDDTGRNSTLEESATIVQLKSAVDSAQELLRAFSEVEKYAKDKEEKSLAGSQDKLNGGGLKTVSAPTDQLTRIGGGSGYASYNNSVSSVEQVQKSIDSSVKTLIANQNNQNNQIIDELRDIKLSNTDAKFG